MRIKCPHQGCKFVGKDWREYAQHILSKHEDDEARGAWARNALKDAEVRETTYHGRSIEAVPPARQKKLLKCIKKQLEEQTD